MKKRAILDEQSGHLKSGNMDSIAKGGQFNAYGIQQKDILLRLEMKEVHQDSFTVLRQVRPSEMQGLKRLKARNLNLIPGVLGEK